MREWMAFISALQTSSERPAPVALVSLRLGEHDHAVLAQPAPVRSLTARDEPEAKAIEESHSDLTIACTSHR
jgi:hypothetical protein